MEHPSNPLLRQVASGWLEGIRSPEYSVLCWLGIPYAAPPVGPLRWRAPQDPIPWEGIRPAKQFGPVSVQKQGTAVVGSEDCLYLNVFRPDTQETLPVFFFIHGGARMPLLHPLLKKNGVPTSSFRHRLTEPSLICIIPDCRGKFKQFLKKPETAGQGA